MTNDADTGFCLLSLQEYNKIQKTNLQQRRSPVFLQSPRPLSLRLPLKIKDNMKYFCAAAKPYLMTWRNNTQLVADRFLRFVTYFDKPLDQDAHYILCVCGNGLIGLIPFKVHLWRPTTHMLKQSCFIVGLTTRPQEQMLKRVYRNICQSFWMT